MSANGRSATSVPRRAGERNSETNGRVSLFGSALPLPLIPLVFALLAALLGLSEDLTSGESVSKRGDGIVEIMLDVSPGELDDVWPDASSDFPFFETPGSGVVGSFDRVPLPEPEVKLASREVPLGSARFWAGRGLVRGPPVLA